MQLSLAVLVALQALALWCALTPVPIGAILPLRIVVAAAVALFLPGALIATTAGRRSRHLLETIAVGAFGSFAVIAVLGLTAMAFRQSMSAVVAALFALNAALTIAALWRRRPARFLTPRLRLPADLVLAVLIAGAGAVAYRWGDDVKAVGWELALHVAYVRQYASHLPLGFDTAVLRPPDVIAQNYLYLWEFALAVVTRIAGVDPLVGALKCRWLMPVLGFSMFFFMVQRLMASTSAALSATWVMMAAVLLQFLTLAPNPYEIYIESGPLRQVGAFFGSIHHSDSAMEILLPLLIGCLFWALRRGSRDAWASFSIALAIAFLWHPREYFQVMWYGGVAILVDAIAYGIRGWRRRAVRYAAMVACYAGVAGLLYLMMPASIRSSSEHVAGLAVQWRALRDVLASLSDWRGWIGGSLPLSTHLHGYEIPGFPPGPPLAFSWLVLAVPMAAVLAWSPSRGARWVGLYLIVLWLVSLCSYKFQQLMQAITYHEMLISKPRLVHLFAYVVIGLGWSEVTRRAAGSRGWPAGAARAAGVAVVLGCVFAVAWRASVPAFTTLFAVLNAAFFATGVALAVSVRRRPALAWWAGGTPPPILVGCAFALFAAPVCLVPAAGRWSMMLAHRPEPADLFSADNPVALAPDTIRFLQSPPLSRARLLVEPNQPYMVGIYAPIYVMPLLGNIGADMNQLQQGKLGQHPVYNAAVQHAAPPVDGIRSFLDTHAIQYVLGTRGYVPAFLQLASSDPTEFAVNFVSEDRSNMVLHYVRRAELR